MYSCTVLLRISGSFPSRKLSEFEYSVLQNPYRATYWGLATWYLLIFSIDPSIYHIIAKYALPSGIASYPREYLQANDATSDTQHV